VMAARGAIVASIEMPWRHDNSHGGVCGGDDQLLW
jgi:hypothetical protein